MKKISIFILFLVLAIIIHAQKSKDYYMNGMAKNIIGQQDSALQYLSTAITLEPGNYRYSMRRGEVLISIGKYEDAIKDFKGVNIIKNDYANYWLAKSYAYLGIDSMAIFYLKKHLQSDYRIPEKIIKTDSAFNLLQYTDDWFELWQYEWYTEEEMLEDDINYLIKKENYLEALTLIDNKLKESKKPEPLFKYKAGIESRQGNFRASAMDWTEVLNIKKDNLYALKERGTAFLNSGKYNESVDDFSKAIRLEPADFELYILRAKAAMGQKDLNSAIKDISLYLEYFPDYEQAIFLCGELKYENGNYVEALRFFNRNLRFDGSKPEYYKARGKTYFQAKMYNYAIDDLSMSLDLKPDDGEVYYFKGLARYYSEDKQGACSDWKIAAKLGEPKAVEQILKNCR